MSNGSSFFTVLAFFTLLAAFFGNIVATLINIRRLPRYRGIPETGEMYKAFLHNTSVSIRKHYSVAAGGLASALKAGIDLFNTRQRTLR